MDVQGWIHRCTDSVCDQENEQRISQPSGTVRTNSASLESSLFDGSVDHGMVVSPTAHKGHEFETPPN